jgi:hypothetical protein
MIDDFHHVPCSAIRRATIAGKYWDEIRRNHPHVCKTNGVLTSVDFGKKTLPAAVYPHRINDDERRFVPGEVFINLPKVSEFEVYRGFAQIALEGIQKSVKRRGVGKSQISSKETNSPV